MSTALRRLRGTLGVGLTWAVGWAVAGLAIGVSSLVFPRLPWDEFFSVYDAPLPTLAVPGFIGGVLFASVLQFVARRRRFEELSLPLVAGAGAAGGLLLSVVPASMVAVGLASVEGARFGVLPLTLIIVAPLTLLSAASATVSFLLARRAQRGDFEMHTSNPARIDAAEHSAALPGESEPAFGQWNRKPAPATRAES